MQCLRTRPAFAWLNVASLAILLTGCFAQIPAGRQQLQEESPGPRELQVVAVTASDYRNEHVASRAIDGDLETRWSARGDGAWIQFDLGESQAVVEVGIAWYKGDEREAEFDIEVSDDGQEWKYIYGAVSSGETKELEIYPLSSPVAARFLRIVGHGNSQNGWNSITEVSIHGQPLGSAGYPELTGIPAPSVVVGEYYRFAPEVAGFEHPVRFRIDNKPSWADFDTETGVLTGVPTPADAGVEQDIVIYATDGEEEEFVGPFSITVKATAEPSRSSQPSVRVKSEILEEDFEDASYQDSGFTNAGAPPVVTADFHPVFDGSRSLQIFLDRDNRKVSPSPYRRELKLVGGNAGAFRNLEYGKEYWVGFALYLADDYRMPGTSDIFFQLHDVPDEHLGESYKNPNLTLQIYGKTRDKRRKHLQHQWVVSIKGDHRAFTPTGNKRYYPTNLAIPVAPASSDVGRWVTWVFHFKVTWNPDGFVRVWKDGRVVLEKYGIRTAFNDKVGPYLAIGSYKPGWKRQGDIKNPNVTYRENPFAAGEAPSRLSYLDAFRIAIGPDRYQDVVP